MEEENREIQPPSDIKRKIENSDKKNISQYPYYRLKKWLKKKIAKERYAILLLGFAIVINIVALIYQSSGNFDNIRSASLFWALSVVLTGLSAWFFKASSRKKRNASQILKSNRQNLPFLVRVTSFIRDSVKNETFLSLFPILLLSCILRIIPILKNGLLLDEWYWLDNAKQIIRGTIVSPFGFIGDQPSNLPAYPLALLLIIVRNPVLAVRLIGIIYSLTAITLVFILLKKTLGLKAAICGSLLMGVSIWDIHMSAIGWLNVNPNPMLVVGVLLALYQIWKQKYTLWTIFWLAFLVAISVHLLYVAALLVVPVFLVLLIHWVKKRSNKKVKEAVLFILFFFVCISPIIPKLIQSPETLSRHVDFLNQNISLSNESKTPLSYYWNQALLLGEDFSKGNVEFDNQGPWGITLDPMIRTLSLLGILFIIIQTIRKKSDHFWLVVIFTFFTMLFIPFIILFRSTSVWRAYPILPIVYLFAIYGIVEISNLMRIFTKDFIVYRKDLFTIFLTTIMLLYFIINFSWFVKFLSSDTREEVIYENNICQTAAKLIDQHVPSGSTIFIPDEMCIPLISILFNENQYKFIDVRVDDPIASMIPGDYVMILDSWQYPSYFNSDAEVMLQQRLSNLRVETVTQPDAALPILYLIR
jgi:hypothetical protein